MSSPKLIVKSEEQRLVFGEVYSPLQVDTQDEAATKELIQKMAHKFLLEGRVNKVDVDHSFKESGCAIVESFIARKNDPDGFIEGAWVAAALITSDLWEQVKKGELNCFSFGGTGTPSDIQTIKVTQITHLFGKTEISHENGPLPPHGHDVEIHFQDGKVLPCMTSIELDHGHALTKSSATEIELDHAHRMITIENEEG